MIVNLLEGKLLGLKVYLGIKCVLICQGTKPEKVNPYAIKAMVEIGIDISQNTSNHASTDSSINRVPSATAISRDINS